MKADTAVPTPSEDQLAAFFAATGLPANCLGFEAWQTLEQHPDLTRKIRERLQTLAKIHQRLRGLERQARPGQTRNRVGKLADGYRGALQQLGHALVDLCEALKRRGRSGGVAVGVEVSPDRFQRRAEVVLEMIAPAAGALSAYMEALQLRTALQQKKKTRGSLGSEKVSVSSPSSPSGRGPSESMERFLGHPEEPQPVAAANAPIAPLKGEESLQLPEEPGGPEPVLSSASPAGSGDIEERQRMYRQMLDQAADKQAYEEEHKDLEAEAALAAWAASKQKRLLASSEAPASSPLLLHRAPIASAADPCTDGPAARDAPLAASDGEEAELSESPSSPLAVTTIQLDSILQEQGSLENQTADRPLPETVSEVEAGVSCSVDGPAAQVGDEALAAREDLDGFGPGEKCRGQLPQQEPEMAYVVDVLEEQLCSQRDATVCRLDNAPEASSDTACKGGPSQSPTPADVDETEVQNQMRQQQHSNEAGESPEWSSRRSLRSSSWPRVHTPYIADVQHRTPTPNVAFAAAGRQSLSFDEEEPAALPPCYADPAVRKFSLTELQQAPLAPEIDPARRELYLSDAEFAEVFGMDRPSFTALPKWRQQQKKKDHGIF
mmetsp:Transcript_96513/g.282087  ORF Transcript_96513/g.282087 Transcript_96513/m.282087 type:complete len:608 (-) Transcript_96513:130-1953(-)